MFTTLYLHWQEEHADYDLRPPATGIIAPVMTVTNGTTYRHNRSRPYRHQYRDRESDKDLIDAVEEVHGLAVSG